MAIRLVVTLTAAPGRGAELAQVYCDMRSDVLQEPGCEQFDVCRDVAQPDKVVLLERWADQAALDAHARVYATRTPPPPELRLGRGEREDYVYNRTR